MNSRLTATTSSALTNGIANTASPVAPIAEVAKPAVAAVIDFRQTVPAHLDNGPERWAARQATAADLSLALDFHPVVYARVQIPTQKIAEVGTDRPVTRTGDIIVAPLSFRRQDGQTVVEGFQSKATLAADGSFQLKLKGGSLAGRVLPGKVEVTTWNTRFEKAAGDRKDLGDISSGLGPNWIQLDVTSTGVGSGAMEINHPQTGARLELGKYTAFAAANAKILLAVLPRGPIDQAFSMSIDAGLTSSEGGLQVNEPNAQLKFRVTGDKTKGLEISAASSRGGSASGALREDGRFFLRSEVDGLRFLVSGLLTTTGQVVVDHLFEEIRTPNVIPLHILRLTDAGLRKALAGQGGASGLFRPESVISARFGSAR